MVSDAAAPSGPSFRNRHAGLIVFGIVQIMFGLLAGCMALLVLFTLLIPKTSEVGAGVPPRMILGVVPLYLAISAVFVILGIGSMMGRRWARALTLVLSWMWLIFGILTAIAFVAMSRSMFESFPPEQAATKPIMIGCMAAIFAIFGVLVPLCFVLFYRSPNVRATVESLDPVPRWTDRVPLPVLAFACWMLLGTVSVAMCSVIYSAIPIGGWMLYGFAATAVLMVFAALSGFIAVGAIRLMPSAWWAAVALCVFGAVYSVVFVPRTDFVAWYETTNVASDPRSLEMIRSMYSGPFFYMWLAVLWGAYLAFLLYIRRYFFGAEAVRT